MSFLRKLLGRTAPAYLARAQKAAAAGEWAEARFHAEDAIAAATAAEGDTADQARVMLANARRHLCEANEEAARGSAEAGEFEAAGAALDVALDYCDDLTRRNRLEQMKRIWLRRGARALEASTAPEPVAARDARPPGDGPAEPDFGAEIPEFELYVASLTESAAERFREQGLDFRSATVSLEQGDVVAAQPVFDKLVKASPDDPLIRFQRGRCRLLAGELDGAVQDLRAVLKAWGYAAIDQAGHLHVGLMLMEAHLGRGQVDEAMEVLTAASAERASDPEVWAALGRLRFAREELDEALVAAERLAALAPRRIDSYYLAAAVARRRDQPDRAIELLERGVSVCCGSGNACKVKPVDVPATRELVELYLDQKRKYDRAEALIHQVVAALDGEPAWFDHYLLARYFQATGKAEQAGLERRRAQASVASAREGDQKLFERLAATHFPP